MDTAKISIYLILIGALATSVACTAFYNIEDTLKHKLINPIPCNKTDFDEKLGVNTTNRCDYTHCKRDDQCQSKYCVTNAPTKQLSPTYSCAPEEYRPKCNASKLFQYYDIDEHYHVIQSKSVCRDSECDWNADCADGLFCTLPPYSFPAVCAVYQTGCNYTDNFVSAKDY